MGADGKNVAGGFRNHYNVHWNGAKKIGATCSDFGRWTSDRLRSFQGHLELFVKREGLEGRGVLLADAAEV